MQEDFLDIGKRIRSALRNEARALPERTLAADVSQTQDSFCASFTAALASSSHPILHAATFLRFFR
jgi:hypothetical protein